MRDSSLTLNGRRIGVGSAMEILERRATRGIQRGTPLAWPLVAGKRS